MTQVISFINYKGGVGKTTMAVEIAATLASKYQFKVLIVDLDPQTNASFYLMTGENPEEPWQKWVDSNGSLKSVLRYQVQVRRAVNYYKVIALFGDDRLQVPLDYYPGFGGLYTPLRGYLQIHRQQVQVGR